MTTTIGQAYTQGKEEFAKLGSPKLQEGKIQLIAFTVENGELGSAKTATVSTELSVAAGLMAAGADIGEGLCFSSLDNGIEGCTEGESITKLFTHPLYGIDESDPDGYKGIKYHMVNTEDGITQIGIQKEEDQFLVILVIKCTETTMYYTKSEAVEEEMKDKHWKVIPGNPNATRMERTIPNHYTKEDIAVRFGKKIKASAFESLYTDLEGSVMADGPAGAVFGEENKYTLYSKGYAAANGPSN